MGERPDPPCPKPQRVRELIEVLGDSDNNIAPRLQSEMIDALDWLATMLENRTTYHKKQQLKTKIIKQLAREHGLEVQANILTNDALHDYVSHQPASKDEFPIHGDNEDEE